MPEPERLLQSVAQPVPLDGPQVVNRTGWPTRPVESAEAQDALASLEEASFATSAPAAEARTATPSLQNVVLADWL